MNHSQYNLAPIALFVYNRPEHTRRTVESLASTDLADQSDLYIFSDGAKTPEADSAVKAVRDYVSSIDGFKSVTVVERPENLGLARSVMTGVTDLVDRFGQIIVLEDDMLFSRGFLDYHNKALTKYRDEKSVLQISGHVFPFPRVAETDAAFFMPLSTSQGWSTWKRAWKLFDPEVKNAGRLEQDKGLRSRFDLDGAFPYYAMLKAQLEGNIDSWAIRWWWSFFDNNGLCLFPRKSLIVNIGFDDQATHTKGEDSYYNDANWSSGRTVDQLPDRVCIETVSWGRLKKYLARKGNPPLIKKIFRFLKKMIG